MTIFGCTAWAIYGLMVGDKYVFLPNSLGIAISMFQFLVYLWIVDVINVNAIMASVNKSRVGTIKLIKNILINARNSEYLPGSLKNRMENIEDKKNTKPTTSNKNELQNE